MLNQAGQGIFAFLHQYGYWLMLPLMILEGPVVTLMAAMMASLGAFNVFVVLLFSIIGDLVGDTLFYLVGYRFGMGFVNNVGKYIGITEKLVLRMEEYFSRHGGKTVFLAKSTTGLCWATFVSAGIVKMDFRKFLKYSFMGGIVWSSFLVVMGYFYGYLWREIRDNIQWIGWVIFLVAIITVVAVTVYKKYQSRRFFRIKD